MNYSMTLPSGMFWHIFRKDWRLLSALVLMNAALQGLLGVVTFHAEPYSLPERMSAFGALITLGLLITMCLLIALGVQQETLPGVSQDWLVRPVKRRDLLFAKLLNVAVFVHGPILVVNLLAGLAEGFSFGQVLRATVLGNLEIALIFTLPVMCVAALTRSIGEALIGALAVFVGLLLMRLLIFGLLYTVTHRFHFAGPVNGTGVEWIWRSLSHAILLLTVVATLALQYFRRDTLRSRVLFIGGLFLFMVAHDLPWAPAFAVQQWLSANPHPSNVLSIAFESGAKPGDQALSRAPTRLLDADSDEKKSTSKTMTEVMLPMRVSGLADGVILHVDYAAVRLVDLSGRTLYRGVTRSIDVRSASVGEGTAVVGQPIEIPTPIYRRLARQPLRVELQYSLTSLRPRSLPSLAALDAHQSTPEMGRCATRVDDTGSAIEVGCRKAGELPFCVSMALEQGARRNPDKFVCELNYEPAAMRFAVEPVDHLQAKLPYRDPTGVANFPVNESGLREARVVLSVYEPEDHFTRQVVIQRLQLSEWRVPVAP